MKIIDLNGSWILAGRMGNGTPPQIFSEGDIKINAVVPGNIESELFAVGLIADPYVGLNAMMLRKYEFYEWCYQREFEYDGDGKTELVFDGLDCYASIFVNGILTATAENAMISHKFDVSSALKKGKNQVAVHIASADNAFRKYPYLASALSLNAFNSEVLRVRKPAHVWGWDIAPRMALGGIFRNVYLKNYTFDIEGYLQQERRYDDAARLVYTFRIESSEYSIDDLKITVDGVCEDSVFHAENTVFSAQGLVRFPVFNPKFWSPRSYGKPYLYSVSVKLLRSSTSEILAEQSFNYGIRDIHLKALKVATDAAEPDFQIYINNVPIRVLGFSHVPSDALHSRDSLRQTEILRRACDLNCNMIRIWGGGIYEDESFYDFCDKNGIMVWQDFMMACSRYPNDDDFCNVIAAEAESVIKRLRHHASVIMWCGDNESDCTTHYSIPRNPNENILTRKILPEAVRLHDGSRPFLPSTPWCSEEAVEQAAKLNDFPLFQVPEQHLWGGMYFKDAYYQNSPASFFSEIGYFGCPALSSLKKFISPEKISDRSSDEWKYHASNAYLGMSDGWSGRIAGMEKQLTYLFGKVPETQEDFILASQITQAEALKYFIEFIRSTAKRSGILWWNLTDCWPEISDAVMDYYFTEKLAYHYIKRAHSDILVLLSEIKNGMRHAIISNYSNNAFKGEYRIYDADTDKLFDSGKFSVCANETLIMPAQQDDDVQKLYLIEWLLEDGSRHYNHYLAGKTHFDLEQYKKWLPKISSGDFDAFELIK